MTRMMKITKDTVYSAVDCLNGQSVRAMVKDI